MASLLLYSIHAPGWLQRLQLTVTLWMWFLMCIKWRMVQLKMEPQYKCAVTSCPTCSACACRCPTMHSNQQQVEVRHHRHRDWNCGTLTTQCQLGTTRCA